MRLSPMEKPPDAERSPNMADYETERRIFSGEAARLTVDGLPGGRGLNSTSTVSYRRLQDRSKRIANALSAERWYRVLEWQRVTVWYTSPTVLIRDPRRPRRARRSGPDGGGAGGPRRGTGPEARLALHLPWLSPGRGALQELLPGRLVSDRAVRGEIGADRASGGRGSRSVGRARPDLFAQTLPRTESGKIVRRELRDRLIAGQPA